MPEDRNCFEHEEFFLLASRLEGQLRRIEELLEAILLVLRTP